MEARAPPSPPSPMVERVVGRVIACGRWIDFRYFDREGFSIGWWSTQLDARIFAL